MVARGFLEVMLLPRAQEYGGWNSMLHHRVLRGGLDAVSVVPADQLSEPSSLLAYTCACTLVHLQGFQNCCWSPPRIGVLGLRVMFLGKL